MIFVFVLDQSVKNLAVQRLSSVPGRSIPVIENVFNFTLATNSGAAWSIFSGSRAFLIIVSFAAFAFIGYMFKAGYIRSVWSRWSMYCVIAGALGNLYDRLFRVGGLVIDMLDFCLINFPIFNVADIFISVGGAFFFVLFVTETMRADKAAKNGARQENSDD